MRLTSLVVSERQPGQGPEREREPSSLVRAENRSAATQSEASATLVMTI